MTVEEDALLNRNVPARARLTSEQRERVDGLTQIFLNEKTFEGCGGLELTEDVPLTIASQACLLLVGLEEVDVPYPQLDVLRIYPSAYRVSDPERDGALTHVGSARLGESSRRGYIVLAWDHVLQGGRAPDDGRNVVLHEFAHQLDTADGAGDGAPRLPTRGLYGPWARVMGHEYERLRATLDADGHDLIDRYGATNPAEFFAVVTEHFFEQGKRLKEEHGALFEVLRQYYRVDPTVW
jgi:Mlc titration factor MtfA (ptsG expression regulator)